MKKLFLVSAALAALIAAPALAADLAVKARPYPPPVPVWSWSGFYIGINGGYSVGTDDFTQTLFLAPGTTAASFTNNTIAPKGGLFGGQIGFNWQTGPVVWGVEADAQWARQTATACGSLVCFNETFAGAPGLVLTQATTVYQKLKWFSTARGRIGWANDGALIYITAGGAWAGIDETDTIFLSTPPTQVASFSRTASGVAYGAGIEMRLWAGWTAKVEYLHLDLSGATNTFALLPPVFLAGSTLTTTTGRIRDDIFRVGLNYKFGWGGPVYAAY